MWLPSIYCFLLIDIVLLSCKCMALQVTGHCEAHTTTTIIIASSHFTEWLNIMISRLEMWIILRLNTAWEARHGSDATFKVSGTEVICGDSREPNTSSNKERHVESILLKPPDTTQFVCVIIYLIAVVFSFSCVGCMSYFWTDFYGVLPLKANKEVACFDLTHLDTLVFADTTVTLLVSVIFTCSFFLILTENNQIKWILSYLYTRMLNKVIQSMYTWH